MLVGGPCASNIYGVKNSQRLQQRNTKNCHSSINSIKITVTNNLVCCLQFVNESNRWISLFAYTYTRTKLFCSINFGNPWISLIFSMSNKWDSYNYQLLHKNSSGINKLLLRFVSWTDMPNNLWNIIGEFQLQLWKNIWYSFSIYDWPRCWRR